MPFIESAAIATAGVKLAKYEGEKLRNPEHRRRRLKQLGVISLLGALAAGSTVGGIAMVHENAKGYIIPELTQGTEITVGEQKVVSTTIDLDKFCAVGYSVISKGSEAKIESNAEVLGREFTYAHRLMQVDAQVDNEFCQEATEANVEYNPEARTYDIYIPTDSMSIATKINYGDGVNDANNVFDYREEASESNLPLDLFDAMIRNTPLDNLAGLHSVTQNMDAVSSFLLKSALMNAESSVQEQCGPGVFEVVEGYYKESVISAAETFTEPITDSIGTVLEMSVYIGSQNEKQPNAPQEIDFEHDYDDEIAKLKQDSDVIFTAGEGACEIPADLPITNEEGEAYDRAI